MTDDLENENEDDVIEEDSTTAENIHAWRELLSSEEAKNFVDSFMEKAAVIFGRTKSAMVIQTITNIALMITAFFCVGVLAYLKLVPEGTTGVLSGIIIGYFFKKNG